MSTTRDPYIAEAAERLARLDCRPPVVAANYRSSYYDSNPDVTTLAETLKELGWKPPVPLEQQAAEAYANARGYGLGNSGHTAVVAGALDAINHYKALLPPARDPQPLIYALEAVEEHLRNETVGFVTYRTALEALRYWKAAQ